MQKFLLSKEHILDLVRENRYRPVDDVSSRCIDGRYEKSDSLPGLAYPGADAGQLLMILSSARSYGFDVDFGKAYTTLLETVGGETKLGFHTDTHHEGVLAGCGHIGQALLNPKEYHVEAGDVTRVVDAFRNASATGAHEAVLQGEHNEGAAVIVRGDYSIYPKYTLMHEGHPKEVSVFVLSQTLIDKRHRVLAGKLLANQAVTLQEGLDGEYLYEVFSEVTETHFLETAKRLAKGLPIYEVVFDEGGTFDILEMGEV